MGFLKWLNAFFIVSRKEYLPSAINEVGIPAALALIYLPFSSNFALLTLAGLTVWWVGHFIGSHINCLADYKVDLKFKTRLPKAVDVIGERNLKIIMAVEVIFITLFVLWLTYILQRPLLLVFWIGGVILAFLYSAQPFYFKGRGLLNPLTLDFVLYVFPMFFVYHLFLEKFYLFPSLVIIIFSLQMIPMFFIDEVSDYEEDKEENIGNPCVRFGRFKITLPGLIIYVVSSALMMGVFMRWYPPTGITTSAIYLLVLACFLWVCFSFYSLLVKSYKFEKETNPKRKASIAQIIKKEVKTPFYLMGTGIGVLFLCATIFIP